MNLIDRKQYLDWLISWKDSHVIKVVSGVRRSGKSKLFEIYRSYLRDYGITGDQVISLNFEDLEFESLTSYRALYDYISARLVPDKMNYVFLDEIQHVEHFEKAVDSLFIKDNVDLYITGSNAYLLSSELATLLSGRYVELKMLPLSFKEFCSAKTNDGKAPAQLFDEYITRGSFPFIAETGIQGPQARDYLMSLYDTIVIRDVIERLKVSDVPTLRDITKFLLHSIGNRISIKKISDTLSSNGNKTDQKTVAKYLKGLTDSLVLYFAPRYNVRGRQLLSTNGKYYAVDLGLRGALVKTQSSDIGHILENVVYLELLRRGYDVYVGDIDGGEIDFVALNSDETAYFQVQPQRSTKPPSIESWPPLRKSETTTPRRFLRSTRCLRTRTTKESASAT